MTIIVGIIEIGLGTDIIKAIFSIFIRPMDPRLTRVMTKDEGTPPTMSRDTSIL